MSTRNYVSRTTRTSRSERCSREETVWTLWATLLTAWWASTNATTPEETRSGPWPRISLWSTWTCVWPWWSAPPARSSNYRAVERTTADRNGSRLSPTRSFVTWVATSAWTAAMPGWGASRWRSAARASTSSGSSPSIYNHRGGAADPGKSWMFDRDTNRLWDTD